MEEQEPMIVGGGETVPKEAHAAFRHIAQAVPMLRDAADLLLNAGRVQPWARTPMSVVNRALVLARDAADLIQKRAGVMDDVPTQTPHPADRRPTVIDLRCADCRFWKPMGDGSHGLCRFDPPGPGGWYSIEASDACGKHEAVTP